jgi:3-oxoacyl-[acyl-carrier-protein] synthase II
VVEVAGLFTEKKVDSLNATTYLRMMGHTAAANIGIYFGLTGRIIPTSSACTSGSQGIGYAFECIKNGYQRVMLAGGAEELCVSEAAVFDRLYATSTLNDTPGETPRPFDKRRDGLVIGEGACTLVLEDYEHARARGATIMAEIVGFATNSDGLHATRPSEPTVTRVMQMALQSAGIPASAIGYVNAHATATEFGDIVESHATHKVFGARIPISSLKSYIGHTLGACGSLEAWASMQMMREDWYAPTINLDQVDERCAELDYLTGQARQMSNEYVMSNNFAFAGINSSIVLKRLQ